MTFPLTPFTQVLSDFRSGKMVIVVDDADRENEGDLTVATECATVEHIAFMMREARGLICISVSPTDAARLSLPLQTQQNNSLFQTAFTVSIDLKDGDHPEASASGRLQTMKAMMAPERSAEDFICPGNVYPLIAHPSGVFGRKGQTEGSYDLGRIAGFAPSGIICEILNPDGTMCRGDGLLTFAKRFDLSVTSVAAITAYRLEQEVRVREIACSILQTDFGDAEVRVFQDEADGREHLALCFTGAASEQTDGTLLRIHSECLTGDVFGSRRCDCGAQLHQCMEQISKSGGYIFYLRQEGRGIGLFNKLRAYALQDCGRDTVEANIELGFEADERSFQVAARMAECLGITRVRLMTNNPKKMVEFSSDSIGIIERVPVVTERDPVSESYLEVKREKLGHLL